MRVLHVQRAKGIAGSEGHLLTLLPALAARGLDVRICVLEAAGGERFTAALRERGVDAVAIRAGPDVNPVAVARLRREIRVFRPDVVHTHLVHADLHGLVAARLCGVPGVSSVHGCPAFYRREPWRSVGRLAGRLARRRIAISRFVADFIAELGLSPVGMVRIVHYGIDADRWQVGAEERAATRSSLKLGPDDIAVAIVARLIPGKGHTSVIDAIRAGLEREPHLRLLVVGDGPLRAELEERARQLPAGTAQFLGWVDDVRPVMGACDLVLFPTEPALGEGFGLAALEALAVGRPVIATDVASLPEVVTHGHDGLIVPPSDPGALADAIVELAADPDMRRRFGEQASASARERFSVEAMVDGTLAVYAAASAPA